MKFATPSLTLAGSAAPSCLPRRCGPASPLDLVRQAVAQHLGIDDLEIHEDQHLEDGLGLDPLDLVLVALRLEELGQVHIASELAEFPVADLERVVTVGDLADMVGGWWQTAVATAPRRPESGIHTRAFAIALSPPGVVV
jgi:acyl carrier protein